ncbi:MAG: CD225/dispanin family protein [Thermoanaerobaculia bacterium]
MSDEHQTYYDILEIKETASAEEVRAAYRRLCHEYHPDKIPEHLQRLRRDGEAKFRELTAAYDVLQSATARAAYDRQLRQFRGGTRSQEATGATPTPSPSSQSKQSACPNCGASNLATASVCVKCGRSLSAGAASSTPPLQIPNYLWQSIVVTLCCCVPLGIVGIVFAAQVKSKLAQGDIAGARDASQKAKMFALIGFGVGVVLTIYMVFFGTDILQGIREAQASS